MIARPYALYLVLHWTKVLAAAALIAALEIALESREVRSWVENTK